MKYSRYAFALMITLAAAPAAAQPVGRGPVAPGPVDPGPVGSGPSGPGPQGVGPVGRVPDAPWPQEPGGPVPSPFETLTGVPMPITTPFVHLPPFELMVNLPAPPMIDHQLLAEARFLADRVAFEYAQDRGRDREAELREREREREAQMYNQGYNAAFESRYDRAITYLNRVIELKGSKLDAALYWKAHSQNRLGQRTEALATLAELAKISPASAYRKQATVLEAEVRRGIGQPVRPQDSTDDEVKLMALQALQHTAPEEAIPMLEKVLEGTSGPKVKQRALYVLAQSKSPRARDVLRNYAKGGSTPELQSQAIQYLGVHGGPEHRVLLGEIYGSTTDVDVKRRILRAFMQAGEKDRLVKAAQGEQNVELRAEAVNQLGHMNAHEELWQLYQKETSIDVKRRILRAMQSGGSIDRVIELAKAEQNPELRRDAVRALGGMRSARTGDALVQIYTSDSNVDVRKSVISALGSQDNATALVALARKEQDINLKKEIVSRLSNMRNKIATDYLIELLGK